jgi:hypothetical protein
MRSRTASLGTGTAVVDPDPALVSAPRPPAGMRGAPGGS